MKVRGSMYEYFASGGSARAAVGGRLLKKPFWLKYRFSEMLTCFGFVWRVVLGVFEEILMDL